MGRQMAALYAGGQLPAGIVEMMQADMTQKRRDLYDKSLWGEAFKALKAGKTYVYYYAVMSHIFPGGHMSERENEQREARYRWVWETAKNWFESLVNHGVPSFRARNMGRGDKYIPEKEEAIRIYQNSNRKWKNKFFFKD